MPVIEDNDKIEETPVDLDRVHEMKVNELEAEQAESQEEGNDTTPDGTNTDKPTPNAESDDDGNDAGQPDNAPNGEGEEGDDSKSVPAKPTPKAEEPEVVDKPQPQAVTPEPEPEVDTDITKNATGKIAVKDSEGNTFYFNNMDEVPDDFEPSTYKEWGVFTSNMAVKAQSDAKAAEERRVREETASQQAEIDEVTNRWDSEIDVLTKGGILPADAKERENEIGDTYAYIAKNLSNGIVIDSFAAANKAMKFDRDQEAKAKANKEKNDNTKKKGSLVMGGGGGTPSGKKDTPEPLPAGTSLDAVHARYSGLNN